MPGHVLDSPLHGRLTVVTSPMPDGHGRPWQARPEPRPPRVAHLLAAHAGSEAEALELLALEVERYDASGLVPREPMHSSTV